MTDERLAELERAASPAWGRFPCPYCGVCDLHAGDPLDVVAELVAEVKRLRAGLAAGRGPQSVEQMCRGLLEEADREGLASFSGDTPQSLSAGELTGMANLLTAYLRTAVAAEREQCAKVCETTDVVTTYLNTPDGEEFEADRGQATLDAAARRIREGRQP